MREPRQNTDAEIGPRNEVHRAILEYMAFNMGIEHAKQDKSI